MDFEEPGPIDLETHHRARMRAVFDANARAFSDLFDPQVAHLCEDVRLTPINTAGHLNDNYAIHPALSATSISELATIVEHGRKAEPAGE